MRENFNSNAGRWGEGFLFGFSPASAFLRYFSPVRWASRKIKSSIAPM
jgi:hypothetical protein